MEVVQSLGPTSSSLKVGDEYTCLVVVYSLERLLNFKCRGRDFGITGIPMSVPNTFNPQPSIRACPHRVESRLDHHDAAKILPKLDWRVPLLLVANVLHRAHRLGVSTGDALAALFAATIVGVLAKVLVAAYFHRFATNVAHRVATYAGRAGHFNCTSRIL
jgi:hypothetical protein